MLVYCKWNPHSSERDLHSTTQNEGQNGREKCPLLWRSPPFSCCLLPDCFLKGVIVCYFKVVVNAEEAETICGGQGWKWRVDQTANISFFKGLDLTPRSEKLTPATRARQLKWTKSFLLKKSQPSRCFRKRQYALFLDEMTLNSTKFNCELSSNPSLVFFKWSKL